MKLGPGKFAFLQTNTEKDYLRQMSPSIG